MFAKKTNNMKAHQKGQAMSEFLVSLAVIAPLFLLIPVVANYLDVQTANHEAARYVAWERTAYETMPSDIQEKVQERFLLKESSGFSAGNVNAENDVRWKDFGRTDTPQVIDISSNVAVEHNSLNLNVNDPVTNSNIPALQAMNADAYGASSVSFPLDSDGSLFGVFDTGDHYLESSKSNVSTPLDPVDGSNRFHTKSAVALLADGGVMPINETDYVEKLTGPDGLVTMDGAPLSFWETPGRIIQFFLAFFGGTNETQILYNGDNTAVVEGQSEILPEGLIEYQE